MAKNQLREVPAGAVNSTQLISSGRVAPGNHLLIVDPQKRNPVRDGIIGEIWVQGNNVGQGYWQHTGNDDVFRARLPGYTCSFLRTGDLGSILAGELYVVGRIKDIIIISGRNHYPQDIEQLVIQSDNRIEPNAVVAFSVENGQVAEQLIIVAEIRRKYRLSRENARQIKDTIQAVIAAQAGIQTSNIHLAPRGTIPYTTSGKPQRRATRLAYQAGSLRSLSFTRQNNR